jgi:hypothetical protein
VGKSDFLDHLHGADKQCLGNMQGRHCRSMP